MIVTVIMRSDDNQMQDQKKNLLPIMQLMPMKDMEIAPDIDRRVPTLAEFAAQKAAKMLISRRNYDDFELPPLLRNVSNAILRQLRLMWSIVRTEDGEEPRREELCRPLQLWARQSNLSITHINLSNARISNDIFTALLTTHAIRLTYLDLYMVQGISAELNAMLREVRLPQLRGFRSNCLEALHPREREGYTPPTLSVRLRIRRSSLCPVKCDEAAEDNSDFSVMLCEPQPSRNFVSERPSIIPEENCEATLLDRYGALPFTYRCPNLLDLIIPKTPFPNAPTLPRDDDGLPKIESFLFSLLAPLKKLRTLDLSYWSRLEDLSHSYLTFQNLTSLVLYDASDLSRRLLHIIERMPNLVRLDVSQSQKDGMQYDRPVTTLHKIVTHLPYLKRLDISGTNLASRPTEGDPPVKDQNMPTDIAGLASLTRKLDFLGLFLCDDMSRVAQIPAVEVAGEANEQQILTALKAYRERPAMLQGVLNECYQLYRFGAASHSHHTEALHLVLDVMARHPFDASLQIAGSAALFYIIRRVKMNVDTKKKVIATLVTGLEIHLEEQVMVRNSCLSLCQFDIPAEVMTHYSRLAVLLVRILERHSLDNLTQRIAVFLLNSMACHVEGDQKVNVGKLGAIEKIMITITNKLAARMADDVMEVGWSFLWNITDETVENCERFLESRGLELFRECYNTFSTERELLRNMMGLIGNIAEVASLRKYLMKDEYLKIFMTLVADEDESIEISYNSAGVLAHLLSDAPKSWGGPGIRIPRLVAMSHVIAAAERWPIDTRRYINYRSFTPILRLLPLTHAYASQVWAAWALANLTHTDTERYVPFVLKEGGLELLHSVVHNSSSSPTLIRFVRQVLANVEEWQQKQRRSPLNTSFSSN